MNYYLYKSTRESTGEYYLGKRCSYKKPEEDSYMGSGTLFKKKFIGREDEWTKEVVEICKSKEHLAERENVLVGDLWETDDLCLNLVPGGEGGMAPGTVFREKHWNYNHTVYDFYHFDGRHEKCTKFDLKKKHGVKKERLKELFDGKGTYANGWAFNKEDHQCPHCGVTGNPNQMCWHRHHCKSKQF